METQYQEASYVNDLFISYSRKDVIFASALEKALKNYSPPKDLVISRRRLVAFRDENDFTGVEYNQSLRKHLENSNKMLVICSPNARSSEFVNEEIRLFAEMRGVENIIPVLLSGIPNNEASIHEHKNQKAFPRSLTDVMPMPLAANFLNLDPTKNKLNKGAFEGPWYTVLANIYGVSRSEVEQRERKRNARTRRIWTAIVTSIIIALTYALILTLIQRDTAVKAQAEAERQEKIATTQRLAAESNAVLTRYPQRAILLAVEAVKVGEDNNFRIASSGEALRNSLLSPSGYGLSGHAGPVRRATISSDNRWLVTASIDKTARLWDLTAADPTQTAVVLRGHEGPISAVVISSDSRWIVTASEDKTARLWDLTAADPSQVKVVLRGHKDMVYAAVISNDSR